MKKYLIIDGNSLGHFSNNGRVLTLGDMQVQAIYGFLRTLRAKMALYSNHTPIVLWDGASWRKMLMPTYKDHRDNAETANEIRMNLQKDKYKLQVPYIKKALKMLGIAQVWSLNMEADDLAAIMTDLYVSQGAQVTLLSGDKDWIQLVGPSTTWADFINKRTVNAANFQEFTGVDTTKKFVEMKALMGDDGDLGKGSGVGGVGEKGAIDFLNKYGSFNEFLHAVSIYKTVDINKLPKKYRALVEDENKALIFDRNIKLMDLRTTVRPAPQNMTVDKGEADQERFARFCELLLFKSILQELDDWLRVFPQFNHLNEGVAA